MRLFYRKRKFLLVLSLIILFTGCAQQQLPAEKNTLNVVCNKPYIIVGTSCCLDKNNNSICDNDEKEEPKIEVKQESKGNEKEDLESAAKSFAYEFARLWEKKDYPNLYDLFISSLKKSISKDEFVYIASQHDEESLTASIRVNEVEVKSPETGYVYLSANILGSDIKIPAMEIQRENNVWKANSFYSFFQPIEQFCDKGNTSTALEYKFKCLYDFAVKFNKPEYCDKAGYYMLKCYGYFSKEITEESIIKNCMSYKFTDQQTDCLVSNHLNPDEIIFTPINISIDINEEIINYSESKMTKALKSLNVTLKNKGRQIAESEQLVFSVDGLVDGWSERILLDEQKIGSSFKQGLMPIEKQFSFSEQNYVEFKNNLSITVTLLKGAYKNTVADKTKLIKVS